MNNYELSRLIVDDIMKKVIAGEQVFYMEYVRSVEAILNKYAAQQSVQPTVLTAFENRHLFCPLCGGEFDVDLPASHSG